MRRSTRYGTANRDQLGEFFCRIQAVDIGQGRLRLQQDREELRAAVRAQAARKLFYALSFFLNKRPSTPWRR